MRNSDYVQQFESHLREEEKSEGTISGYISDVKDFLKFVKKDISKVKRDDVNGYKDHLRKRGLKTLSLNRKLVGIKQFIDFLNDRYELGISARIKQDKVQKQYSLKDEDLLSQKDFEQLLESVEAAGDIRAKALFETMAYSGMRISEALQLRVDHVKNQMSLISDIKGKGGKYRDIYINDTLMETLTEYLKARHLPFSHITKALFVGERGPITRQNAHYLIKKYAKAAGIEETKAHVHNLRHLFGLNLAAEGMPIEEIAQLMGHETIETTKIYLTKPQSYYKNRINKLSFIGKRKVI